MTDLVLSLRLTADKTGLVGALKVSKEELEKLAQATQKANAGAAHGAQAAGRETGRLTRTVQDATAKFETFGNRARAAFERSRSSAATFHRTLAGIGLAFGAREIAQASVSIERLRTVLQAATGDAAKGRAEWELLNRTVDALGLPLRETGEAYTKLLAAARGTALEGQGARNIFLATAEAAASLKMSAEEVFGTMRAFEQMISKGYIMAEELRGQLGDRLPGAIQLMAQALQVDTGQLQHMVETGQVLSVDLLKLADVMHGRFGRAAVESSASAQAQFSRFNNEVQRLLNSIGESGFMDGLIDGMASLRQTFADPQFRNGLELFGRLFGETIRFTVEHIEEILLVIAGFKGLQLGVELGRAAGGKGLGTAIGGALGTGAGVLAAREILEFLAELRLARDQARGAGGGGAPSGFQEGYRPDAVPPKTAAAIEAIAELQRDYDRIIGAQALAGGSLDDRLRAEGMAKARDIIAESRTKNPEQIRDIQALAVAVQKATSEYQAMVAVMRDLRGAFAEHEERMRALNTLYSEGQITIEEYARAKRDADIRMLDSQYDLESGIRRGFLRVGADMEDLATSGERLITGMFWAGENAVREFARTGKINFNDFAASILADLLSIQFRMAAVFGIKALGLGNLFGIGGTGPSAGLGDIGIQLPGGESLGGTPLGALDFPFVGHGGGIAGETPRSFRWVDPDLWQVAPRLHGGGLLPGEVPAILKRGEEVITEDDPRHVRNGGGGVTVNIIDQRGADAPPVETSRRGGPGGTEIIDVIVKESVGRLARRGELDGVMQQNWGASRMPVLRG